MDHRKEKKIYTVDDVRNHRSIDDCWIILGEPGSQKVYDITKFLDDHPGGPEILLDVAGQNANDEFEDIGHSNDARKMLDDLYIGDLENNFSSVPLVNTERPLKVNKKVAEAYSTRKSFKPYYVLLGVIIIILIWFLYPVE